MIDSVVQLLTEARAKIADPKNWIKGRFVVDDCYCSVGAVYMSAVGEDNRAFRMEAIKALRVAAGVESVIDFNDAETTSHADVLAMFDKAIANACPYNS